MWSSCRLGVDHYYIKVRSGVPVTRLPLVIYNVIVGINIGIDKGDDDEVYSGIDKGDSTVGSCSFRVSRA